MQYELTNQNANLNDKKKSILKKKNHGSIKPSRDLLKNEKEESYVNTTE